jgi:hypothetical protein
VEAFTMPNAYVVLGDGELVLERWTGSVTHEELIAHERAQIRDPAIKPGAVMLVDATRARIETPLEAVHELSDLYADDSERRIAKCAMLVNGDTYEQAQLFAAQAAKLGMSIIVFNLIDTACLWLGIDRDTTRAQLDSIRI